jgi:hypothetical protein
MMARNALVRRGANAYVAFFEALTPDTLADLPKVAAADVRFRDPFNDVVGIDALRTVFDAMFRDLRSPRFRVSHTAFDDDVCLMRWSLTAEWRFGDLTIEGMSTLRFDDSGRVTEHVDYWDAGSAVYEQVPVIGRLIRVIRKRLAA